MKALAALLAIVSLAATPAVKSWKHLDRLYPSVAKLHIAQNGVEQGHCTIFMINDVRHLALSAAHCVEAGDAWQVEYEITQSRTVLTPATVVASNTLFDLAVFSVEGWRSPALKLRAAPVRLGMPVAAMGYGLGAVRPVATYGWVSHPNLPLPVPGVQFPPGLVVFGNYIAGMSGGPIVDEDERVVSVVQAGGTAFSEAQDLGYGVLPESLQTFAARYWR